MSDSTGEGGDGAGRAWRAFEDDWATGRGGCGELRGVERGGTLNVLSTECWKDDDCVERVETKAIVMRLQSVWLAVFGASQYLEAETL